MTKNVTVEQEVVAEIYCNLCGNSCKPLSCRNDERADFYGLIEATFSSGYNSPSLPDGSHFTFSLCEPCCAGLFAVFKHPPLEHLYLGRVDDEDDTCFLDQRDRAVLLAEINRLKEVAQQLDRVKSELAAHLTLLEKLRSESPLVARLNAMTEVITLQHEILFGCTHLKLATRDGSKTVCRECVNRFLEPRPPQEHDLEYLLQYLERTRKQYGLE